MVARSASIRSIKEFMLRRVLSCLGWLGWLTFAIIPLGCRLIEEPPVLNTFDEISAFLQVHADAIVLEGDENARVLISPELQGRVMTLRVGNVESTGLVNAAQILAGDTAAAFNNHGGADRFWIGPEAGQYGVYFPPGAELNRETWFVPKAFNNGPFVVDRHTADSVQLHRDMELSNYIGTTFKVRVDREVGVLRSADLHQELGVTLPDGVSYAGAYSENTLKNTGAEAWTKEKGLIGVWILGMFNPSDESVVIGPFKPGDAKTLGMAFNDEYFGKVTQETPDRLKIVGNAVLFRADSRKVGKFGIGARRTTGLAGAIDFHRQLLTVVKFDTHGGPGKSELYGSSLWLKEQPEPYNGDVFQSYNNGGTTEGELADVPFFELESASPVRPLKPGESLAHRHATHHFQGELDKLAPLARTLLGVDLQAARVAMLGAKP